MVTAHLRNGVERLGTGNKLYVKEDTKFCNKSENFVTI